MTTTTDNMQLYIGRTVLGHSPETGEPETGVVIKAGREFLTVAWDDTDQDTVGIPSRFRFID